MSDTRKRGLTSQSEFLYITDSAGAPKTDLAWNSSNAAAKYIIDGDDTAITLKTLASATAAYDAGGFIHVANGNYRIDVPDAAYADANAVWVIIYYTADGAFATPLKFRYTEVGNLPGDMRVDGANEGESE